MQTSLQLCVQFFLSRDEVQTYIYFILSCGMLWSSCSLRADHHAHKNLIQYLFCKNNHIIIIIILYNIQWYKIMVLGSIIITYWFFTWKYLCACIDTRLCSICVCVWKPQLLQGGYRKITSWALFFSQSSSWLNWFFRARRRMTGEKKMFAEIRLRKDNWNSGRWKLYRIKRKTFHYHTVVCQH